MERDVIEICTTTQILNESPKPTDFISSVDVLKDELENTTKEAATTVIFKNPTSQAAKHINHLYISRCLDGMPVNRLLVDIGVNTSRVHVGSNLVRLWKKAPKNWTELA